MSDTVSDFFSVSREGWTYACLREMTDDALNSLKERECPNFEESIGFPIQNNSRAGLAAAIDQEQQSRKSVRITGSSSFDGRLMAGQFLQGL
jgi:hypothetical protein